MAFVAHEAGAVSEDDYRYANFVEYGRRFEKILAEARKAVAK
jgi:hypothetical protein